MEEITYHKWLLSHTLNLINIIYRSSAKKDRKRNSELAPLNYEQIATLYMDESMELPFEVIVDILGRKSGNVRKRLTRAKSLLLSSKGISELKSYMEGMIAKKGTEIGNYDRLIQDIYSVDGEVLREWETSFPKTILQKRISRYSIILIPPLLIVLAVCITSYIKYDNYKSMTFEFGTMSGGDPKYE